MPSQKPQYQIKFDDIPFDALLQTLRTTTSLNGNRDNIISEVTELRKALAYQITHLIFSSGEINETFLMRFMNCYDIPNKLRESVLFATRATIKNSVLKN